jgi:Zn-dependent M28 family amino/carboxypeptidase
MVDRLRAHVAALVGERHPLTARSALLKAQQYLTTHLAACGLTVSTHAFQALGGTYRNVIGTRPASANSARGSSTDAPLIVAAHYDTVAGSPGADDNASGLAAMIEIAERLRSVPLARPVRFIAFCLEEHNLLGSLAYVATLQATKQSIHGAIVLECVGYTAMSQVAPPGTPVAVPTTGDFLAVVGNEASAGLVKIVHTAGRLGAADLKMVPLLVPGQGESLPDTRRSDHAAFWQHGYPAVMLTDTANFRNPHYHQPTDRLETLNFQFLERVTAAVTAAAMHLAGGQ